MNGRCRSAIMVAMGLIYLMTLGCSSDGDSGRIEELEKQLEDLQSNFMKSEDDRKEAETQREEAETQLDNSQSQLTALQQQNTELESQLTTAQQEVEQEQERNAQLEGRLTEAQQAELRARADKFNAELQSLTGADADKTDATVSWMRGGSLQFMPQGTYTRGTAAPSVPGGWRSASFTGHSGTAADLSNVTAYLYTNIQAPGSRAFWKEHGLDEPMSSANQNLARASGSPLARTVDGTTTTTLTGSFDGAGGSFTCSGDCTATVTIANGQPTFSAPGDWTFTPSNINNGVLLDQDEAFLYFGIWASEPVNISGTPEFRYIAGGGAGTGASSISKFNKLTGTATFRGGAVGKYVTEGQVGPQNANIGTFTAIASFTADFSTDSLPGTLHGQITDFREDGSPLTGWSVTLGKTGDVATPADIATTTASGDTVASIGGLAVGGNWEATFYGIDNHDQDLSDRTKYPVTRYPVADLAGVAGWFDATSDNASLAGAFAATPSSN